MSQNMSERMYNMAIVMGHVLANHRPNKILGNVRGRNSPFGNTLCRRGSFQASKLS